MTNAIANEVINKRKAQETQKQKVTAIQNVLTKYKISKRKLLNQYNSIHTKSQIAYVTFYYKFRMLTFTDVELSNLKNMVDAIDNHVKNSKI